MTSDPRFIEVTDLKTYKSFLIQLRRVRRIHREFGGDCYLDVLGNSDPSKLSSFDYMIPHSCELDIWYETLYKPPEARFVDVILPSGHVILINKICILSISLDPFIIEIAGKDGLVSCTKTFDSNDQAIDWYRAQKII